MAFDFVFVEKVSTWFLFFIKLIKNKYIFKLVDKISMIRSCKNL